MMTKKTLIVASAALIAAISTGIATPSAVAAQPSAGINYKQDADTTITKTFNDMRDVRFCEIFFIKVRGDMNELYVYNPPA